MSSVTDDLKQVLQVLPYGDRADLVHFLVDSLNGEFPVPDPSSRESLDETLKRRLKEIQCGVAVGEPAFEAIARLRAQRP